MLIQFDATCRKCRRPFKAEADTGPVVPGARDRYTCACPRCYTPVTLQGDDGTATTTATGWAIRATPISDTSPPEADAAG